MGMGFLFGALLGLAFMTYTQLYVFIYLSGGGEGEVLHALCRRVGICGCFLVNSIKELLGIRR